MDIVFGDYHTKYKMVAKYIRERTNKEFFMTRTENKEVLCVISRNEKLLVWKKKFPLMSYFQEEDAQEILNFVNQ